MSWGDRTESSSSVNVTVTTTGLGGLWQPGLTVGADAIPPHSTAVVDEPWNGPEQVAMCPAARGPLRAMHAWVDSGEDQETKSAYALPHHMMRDGRVGPANVNGVRNALARLPQSRIPESDHAAVKRHLQGHLDDFNSRREESMDYPRIVRAIAETPWAILPGTLAVIIDLISLRASGERLTVEEIQARVGQRPPGRSATVAGSVAILPLHGVLIPRATLLADVSGATSLERFTAEFRDALDDRQVDSIVFDVDSPGGMVAGVPELAAEIRAARGRKPIVAVANTSANSAAYWIASQADEVVATPTADVGSIGVIAAHEDISAMQEKLGVKTTLITSGRRKGEGNPFEPLTDEAKAAIQERVDEFGEMFIADVARGRGVTAEQVRGGFGEGGVVTASAALKAGMIDKVGTLEETVSQLARRSAEPGFQAAALGRAAPPGEPEDHDDTQAANSGLSFADETDALRDRATHLVERAASLAEVERGHLTVAKRAHLTACTGELREAVQKLDELLAATDPHTAAMVREHARFLAGHPERRSR